MSAVICDGSAVLKLIFTFHDHNGIPRKVSWFHSGKRHIKTPSYVPIFSAIDYREVSLACDADWMCMEQRYHSNNFPAVALEDDPGAEEAFQISEADDAEFVPTKSQQDDIMKIHEQCKHPDK